MILFLKEILNIFVFKYFSRPNEGRVLTTGWHRITLTQAAKYSKETVLQALANSLNLRSIILEPIAFKLQGPHYAFHVSVFVAIKWVIKVYLIIIINFLSEKNDFFWK